MIVCAFSSIAADTVLTNNPSSDNLIPSVNDLITELPPITDPLGFCICLDLPHSHCEQILRDQGNTKSQVTKVVAEWHTRSLEPTWEKVVAALFCHQHNRTAVELAKMKGVDWRPLQSKRMKQ